jgi:geranylgeranyl diphosphate synthase, type I
VAVSLKQEIAFEDHPRDVFRAYISKARSQIESELSRFVARLPELSLHPQIEYAVLSKGKRLRPLLVILSAESVGGSRKEVMPLALAFEFMHTATLVHDDIIDQDDMRRDRLAIHKKWSMNQALLTGDSLIALAVDLASTYGETIMKTVARSALDLCDGENMDIAFSPKMMTEKSYFQKIRKKSASLFQAATYSGALAGEGIPTEVNSLSAFGENFGMAYQLRDDLLDLTSMNASELKDLRRGRLTLPLIHSYSNCSLDERRRIDDCLQPFLNTDIATNAESTKQILEIIRKTGSREYCEKRVDEFLRQAVANISELKQSEYRTYLVEMVKALKSPV